MMRPTPAALLAVLILTSGALAQGGWSVSATLGDEAGAAVPGARVSSSAHPRAVAPEDGAFRVPLAAAPWLAAPEHPFGSSLAKLYVHPPAGWVADSYAVVFQHTVGSHAPPRPVTLAAPLVLRRGASSRARGIVADTAGAPVAGALLVLAFGAHETLTWTDEDGAFETLGALPAGPVTATVFPARQFDVPGHAPSFEHDPAAPRVHRLTIETGPRLALAVQDPADPRRAAPLRARLLQRNAAGGQRRWSWRPVAPERDRASRGATRTLPDELLLPRPGILYYARDEFPPEPGWESWVEVEGRNGFACALARQPDESGAAPLPVLLAERPILRVSATSTAGELAVQRDPETRVESPPFMLELEPLELAHVAPFGPRPALPAGRGHGLSSIAAGDPGRYRVTIRAEGCRPEVRTVDLGSGVTELEHVLLVAEHAPDVIEGVVTVPAGSGPPIAVVHLASRWAEGAVRSTPALPPLLHTRVRGEAVVLADAAATSARFRFTDLEPGDYDLWVEPLNGAGAPRHERVRAGRTGLVIPLTPPAEAPVGFRVRLPDGARLERAPVALQSPAWPFPVLFDVPLDRPVLRWAPGSELEWCVRVPGYAPAYGGHGAWRGGAPLADVALEVGWGFELALREGCGLERDANTIEARWRALVEHAPLAGVEIALDGVAAGVTDARGVLRLTGDTYPERFTLALAGYLPCGHHGWERDGRRLFDAPQPLFRMRPRD
jgi:hypothetical protein